MANLYGPKIVTSGLSILLDANNNKSYPGSGNTWYDISGNNQNGTIYPRTDGFTVSNRYLSFPDTSVHPTNVNSYAYIQTPISTGSISYTATAFVRVYSTNYSTTERHIVRTSNNFGIHTEGSSSRLKAFTTNYNVEAFNSPNGSFLPNIWYMVTLVYDRDNYNQKLYINAILQATKTHTVQYNLGTAYIRWLARDDTYVSGLNGDCGLLSFYTRALSASEILQNYNATKGRFGL